jgi:hypothetical protein
MRKPSPRISPTTTFFTWPSIICNLQLTSPPSLPSPNQNYRMIGDGSVPNR